MNIFNPWTNDNIFVLPNINSHIKLQVTKNNKNNLLNFKLKYELNNIIILTTSNINKNTFIGHNHLTIKIINGVAYIEHLSKMKKYSGTILMKLALQVLKKLNITKCELIDNSTIKCILKNNTNKYLNYKIITLLKYGETYYMKFGFIPYNSLNYDLSYTIKSIINNLKKCNWNNIDNYFNILSRNINTNYRLKLHTKALDNWIEFKEQFNNLYDNPFKAFQSYNDENCYLFNDWLNYILYISRLKNIESININNYNYIKKFNELDNILLDIKWINNNI
jgi:hypothetical protein